MLLKKVNLNNSLGATTSLIKISSSEKLQNLGEEKSELWCCLYFGMESCDAADPVDGVNVSDPKCVCGIQLNWINLI